MIVVKVHALEGTSAMFWQIQAIGQTPVCWVVSQSSVDSTTGLVCQVPAALAKC